MIPHSLINAVARRLLVLLACAWPLWCLADYNQGGDFCAPEEAIHGKAHFATHTYLMAAARKHGITGEDISCAWGTNLYRHVGGECAKQGVALETPDQDRLRQCVERGLLDYDCRNTRNPNPQDTPEACVQRRLAGGPKWLIPGSEAPPPPPGGDAASVADAGDDQSAEEEGGVEEEADAGDDQSAEEEDSGDEAADDDAGDVEDGDGGDDQSADAEDGDEAGDEGDADEGDEEDDDTGDELP